MNLRLRVPGDPWLYAFARALLVTAVQVYGRVCVFGAGNLPAAGPVIVVANHPSDVDPILLGVALPRTLHFMADAVQFRRGFVGPVIERLAAFPIHKGEPDRAALERALGLLAEGEVVVLFAEGDLYRRADPTAFRSGVAFLAARSGAPVVPVAIVGAERIWAGGRVHWPWLRLTVGQPITFDGAPHRKAAYARMAGELRDAVIRLREGVPEGEGPQP
jgi:1-acyl-sn-glycerol-3-phosphate acyltransferase